MKSSKTSTMHSTDREVGNQQEEKTTSESKTTNFIKYASAITLILGVIGAGVYAAINYTPIVSIVAPYVLLIVGFIAANAFTFGIPAAILLVTALVLIVSYLVADKQVLAEERKKTWFLPKALIKAAIETGRQTSLDDLMIRIKAAELKKSIETSNTDSIENDEKSVQSTGTKPENIGDNNSADPNVDSVAAKTLIFVNNEQKPTIENLEKHNKINGDNINGDNAKPFQPSSDEKSTQSTEEDLDGTNESVFGKK